VEVRITHWKVADSSSLGSGHELWNTLLLFDQGHASRIRERLSPDRCVGKYLATSAAEASVHHRARFNSVHMQAVSTERERGEDRVSCAVSMTTSGPTAGGMVTPGSS